MAESERPFVLQWNLRTMFSLTAVMAVWIAYSCLLLQNARLQQEITLMQEWDGELLIKDTEQIAVVRLPETWNDENRWDIHLPEGEYVMRLATREIGEQGLAPVVEETVVNSGKHRIELLQSDEGEYRRIAVMVNDRSLIKTAEASDKKTVGSSVLAGLSTCTQFPPQEPVVLYRRRFIPGMGVNMVGYIGNGLLLWIERIEPADTAGEDL